MERFFDTHAHYTDEKLAGNFALTDELFASDICGIICVATDNDDAKKMHCHCGEISSYVCKRGYTPERMYALPFPW